MTKATLLFAVPLALAAFGAHGAEGTPGNPLRPQSECLDPTQARGWAIVDTDRIVVDAGRRKFELRFGASCPELEWTRELRFRTPGGTGRICGTGFDAVLPESRGGIAVPCAIRSITPIDAERYRELTSKAPGDVEDEAAAD